MKKLRFDQCACMGEKALRVPRAVNFGWRFTARMQVNWAVRNLGETMTKTKISLDLWKEMPSKQFSHKPEVITYPEMYSWRPGYSLGPRGGEACVFLWHIFFTFAQVTLRAFLALRVIGMQWKSCRNEVVKKIESSQTKSKISQNLNWELDTGAIFQ